MKTTSLLAAIGCAAILMTAAGCVERVAYEHPGPVFVGEDDYVYYPAYGIYYGTRSHRYYYQEGPQWVARPAPPGVPIDKLRSAPSVKMNFHDSPAAHHAQDVRKYPKNWKPPGISRDHHENPEKDNK
jgi:hypothetical protein